jgi:hypothetical protein
VKVVRGFPSFGGNSVREEVRRREFESMTRKVEKEMKPVLAMLGPRPGADAVEAAKQAIVLIERKLAVESAVEELPVSNHACMQPSVRFLEATI